MSEALDKVRGVRELPLFPLPLVLFPGVPLPLHIFEERYRRMLADVRASNNLFGLSYFDPNAADGECPPAGHVGCATEVAEAQQLPDGRSNILTVGLVRYRVAEYVERGDPYLFARVEFFEDEESDAQLLTKRAEEVTGMFMRIARAMRTINDERGGLPDLPQDDPERLSFLVAAVVEMDADAKQQLLELRSTTERLRRLYTLLSQAVEAYESRARTHELARGNGHGGKKIDFEE
ncbi:MAG TPA: LON peptidase substrate-binding domain-containing protein [Pyrinomonadaceae bacterium]|jgi:Lon protease-like protein|nr:LON peptidase substrate-binding domain-containing protein [Pyrinomonadaceae bacterium]